MPVSLPIFYRKHRQTAGILQRKGSDNMYKLYEYRSDDVRIGLIISEQEQCLYIGNKLYSARTNVTPEKQSLDSDMTGRGLVKIELEPLRVTIAGKEASPVYEHEEPDKASILQHWNARLASA